MMARTQISLDEEMLRKAKARSGELRISLAEYIRRLIARDMERSRPGADPSLVFDLGDSGGSDIAAEKDRMMVEAIAGSRSTSKRTSSVAPGRKKRGR
jgi:hypothetical protein